MARSNRQLTQFVVDKIRQSLVYGVNTIVDDKAGNTEVVVDSCAQCSRPSHVVVKLFNKEIIRLFYSPLNPAQVLGIMVSTGDFYDSKGRPSRTTRERLNGILDALGTSEFLPEGVRVFVKPEDGQCYLGKGDAARVFNSASPKIMVICRKEELLYA